MNDLSPVKKALTIKALNLFALNKINSLPMKLYSDDDDVDIVIINRNQYEKAIKVLLSKNWYKKNNRSKLRERDKDFFHHRDSEYVIHLHKAFSWNTVTYLDSQTLWERKRVINEIPIPSIEDELLIIAAHSLFENQYVKTEEVLYGRKLLESKYDLNYMKNHAKSFHWENGLNIIIKKLKNNISSLSIYELLEIKINKLKQDFGNISFRLFIIEIINYFCIDWIWNYRIMLLKRLTKRPAIISVSGVDGSGKTTGSLFLYEEFKKIGKQVKMIHTGTTPLLRQDANGTKYRFSPIGYLSLIKDSAYILFSLLTNIHYDVVIFDRYIYDSLVKITYKQKRKTINKFLLLLLTWLIPKPKLSLLFEVPPKLSHERDRNYSLEYHEEKYSLYNSLSIHIPSLMQIKTVEAKNNIKKAIKTKIRPMLNPNNRTSNSSDIHETFSHQHSNAWEVASLKKRRNLTIRKKRILKFGINTNTRVLDLGCGDGLNIKIFINLGIKNIVGIDMSEYLLEQARIKNPNVQLVVGNAEKMPFTDNSFDIVFIDSVLHHFPEYGKVITEIKRVLTPHGYLCFIEPRKTWLRSIVNWIITQPLSEIIPFFKKRRATYSEEKYMDYWLQNHSVFFQLLEKGGFKRIMLEKDFLSIMGKYKKI